MIIDTHTHTYFAELEALQDAIIAKMLEQGVVSAVQIGCDIESSQKAVALAKRHPGTYYATVWFHPTEIQDWTEEQIDTGLGELEAMIVAERNLEGNERQDGRSSAARMAKTIVGIGETGLDYHYLEADTLGQARASERVRIQKYAFTKQAGLAAKYGLPVIIHNRDARDDMLEMIGHLPLGKYVMHCYSEDAEYAERILALEDAEETSEKAAGATGLALATSSTTTRKRAHFSFSGILTYKSATGVQEAARTLPTDRILVETDAPFLAPQPVRGTTNEPANTRYVLQKLIELRGATGVLEREIHKNSCIFYGITLE